MILIELCLINDNTLWNFHPFIENEREKIKNLTAIQDRRLKFLVKILFTNEKPVYDLFGLWINQSWILNQDAVTVSNEPSLKAAHLFKRKMADVSWKHLGNTHRLVSAVSLQWFRLTTSFFFKDPCFIGSTDSVVVASASAVAALIDQKIQLWLHWN